MIKLISGQLFLRLMKFILLQFVILYGVLASTTLGQSKVSLTEMKLEVQGRYSVDEIFRMIEAQSDLSFSYHKKDINSSLNEVIEFTSRENSVYGILLLISESEKLRFKRINETINVLKDKTLKTPVVEEENYPIQGRVVDETGEGLPGASVIIKGTALGTVTNVNGEFSLDIPEEGNSLIISFVGYVAQEVAVENSSTSIVVRMELDLEALDEVVVVGYGQQKKESISGSVAKIDSDDIMKTRTSNIANNVAGRIPGLIVNARGGEPGNENMEVFIRGKATMGDATPLYVIDGVANRGNFQRLNPQDIESISILKDASAAIYGAQAANGVILITTKRGKEGKPTFNYNSTYSFTQPAMKPQLMNAVQYLTWLDERNSRNGRPVIYKNIIDGYKDGDLDPEVWSDTDWWDASMKNWTPQTQHDLSLSGGTDKIKYYVSGQHLNQEAIYKGDAFGYKQSNVRSNIDINATEWLKLGLDLAGRFENRNSAGYSSGDTENLIRGIYSLAPFESPYYSNGLLRKTSKGNIIPYLNGSAGGNEVKNTTLNNKLTVDISLDRLVKGLSIYGWGAVDIINSKRRQLQTPYDIYFLNVDGEYENQYDQTGKVTLFEQYDDNISKTYHAHLNYDRTFDKHHISGFVAYEQNTVNGEYLSAYRYDLISADLPYIFTGSQVNKNNDGKGNQSARQNYFGRVNYSYMGKYLLEFTARRDGSQNFAAGKRFGTFPGISAAWRISDEGFFGTGGLVDDLKVRASWGKLGNDKVNNFQYYQVYNVVDAAVMGEDPLRTIGLTPNTTANPNITWETSEKVNFGLDGGMREGLLDFTVDLFHESRSNILTKRNFSVPTYTGLILPDANIGKTINKGVELSVLHRNKVFKNLEYRVSGQMTYARNKIIYMDESPSVPKWQKREGNPIDYLLVYQSLGIYQNQEEIDGSPHFPDAKPGDVKFKDVSGDGKMDTDDRIILPQGPTPRITYGFNLGVAWKGLELNAFFQGQAQASTIYRPWDVNQNAWYFENRWISETATPNAKSPGAWDMSSNTIQSVSTIWVKRNDFLRFKNLELAYSIPDKVSEKLHVSNLRFFVSGFNLGFLYNAVKLYDPESRSDTGWYYPQQRVISTGLSLSI